MEEIIKKENIKVLPDEEWRHVVGYEGRYIVSNKGRVYSLTRLRFNGCDGVGRMYKGRMLKGEYCRGYYCVSLRKEGSAKLCKVHRLVAMAFISNPENKPQIDHIDGNPRNNNVYNLRWATAKENVLNPNTLCHKTPLMAGGNNPMAIKVVSVSLIDGAVRFYESATSALPEIGVKDAKYICECFNGRRENYKGRKWYKLDDYNKLFGKNISL